MPRSGRLPPPGAAAPVRVVPVRPRIGLTCDLRRDAPAFELSEAYVRAVVAAGGLPLLLPPVAGEELVDAWLACVDGLLLTGGVDVDPVWYGRDPAPRLGRISPDRDALELPLARAALERGLPLLAICRGVQVLNVAAGGTLVQDLPSEWPGAIKHYQEAPRWYPTHAVEVVSGSTLARLLGTLRPRVNSFHHQAVLEVGRGLVVAARAPDGVVEAVESADPDRFALGVQWHPEAMWERDPASLRLFAALVEAARRRAAGGVA